jgi:hypothetical protein
MTEYLCSYFVNTGNHESQYYFKCHADDEAHAKEQLSNAEPRATDIFCEIYSKD